MNKKLEKLDEIDSRTKDLFVAEKATLDQISKCIEELKTSGQNGFTLQSLPPWATAMQNVLIKKYTDDMLNGDGRLNEDFVEKFADLTVAEMTPAEKYAYTMYVKFLILDAEPEDMNLVIEHLTQPVYKPSARELAGVMDVATIYYCANSREPVDTRIIERSAIMWMALTKPSEFQSGTISLKKERVIKDGQSKVHEYYEYSYRVSGVAASNYGYPTSVETYRTDEVDPEPGKTGGAVGEAKDDYYLSLIDKDAGDYAQEILAMGVAVGLAMMDLSTKAQLVIAVATSGYSMLDLALSDEEQAARQITPGSVSTMTERLQVRIATLRPEGEYGPPIFKVYPTCKTQNRINAYNEVIANKNKDNEGKQILPIKPITIEDVYFHPEVVDNTLADNISAPYKYNGEEYDEMDDLEAAIDKAEKKSNSGKDQD